LELGERVDLIGEGFRAWGSGFRIEILGFTWRVGWRRCAATRCTWFFTGVFATNKNCVFGTNEYTNTMTVFNESVPASSTFGFF
jgi:hypothetical protein